MLIQFSLGNFRSVAETQAISMVAGPGAKRQIDRTISTGNSTAPFLLPAACLFGPNGAGKTTLIKALDFFVDFVGSSAKDRTEGDPIAVEPFLLGKNFRTSPSEFEAVFIHEDTLFKYGFSVDKERVWAEWLTAKPNSPKSRTRDLFSRQYLGKKQGYKWKINDLQVKGEKSLWKSATRDNALFLSTAVQLKSESLFPPFDWIRRCLRVVSSPRFLLPEFTARKCLNDTWQGDVLQFLQAADIRIEDFRVSEIDPEIDETALEPFSKEFRKKLIDRLQNEKTFRVKSVHRDREGKLVEFDFSEESVGSQVIFNLAGPWIDVLKNGYTLVVDELHNSLHPLALKFLVSQFHNSEINPLGAQILFTSHDTSVMAKNFLKKDQIWLVEKDETEASHFYALSDFNLREVEAFQKAYLNGKYGAVPLIMDIACGQEQ